MAEMKDTEIPEWLAQYDKALPKFEWFIHKHEPLQLVELQEARLKGDVKKMLNIMNSIWFDLPDRIFNIKENPKGWREFINLIEPN